MSSRRTSSRSSCAPAPLPAAITVLEQRTIGPELGQGFGQCRDDGGVVALVAVGVFMVLVYGLFRLFANVALLMNIVLIFALMTLIGATLTMPGIAGIV